jgi:hypothetical protein
MSVSTHRALGASEHTSSRGIIQRQRKHTHTQHSRGAARGDSYFETCDLWLCAAVLLCGGTSTYKHVVVTRFPCSLLTYLQVIT